MHEQRFDTEMSVHHYHLIFFFGFLLFVLAPAVFGGGFGFVWAGRKGLKGFLRMLVAFAAAVLTVAIAIAIAFSTSLGR